MEVVDSPLNLAHQQNRKADRLLATGKYEEAISCHVRAADLLKEAMKLTECEQARVSLELQRDSHIKQQRLIQERWKRARREPKARPSPAPAPLTLAQPQPLLQPQAAAPAQREPQREPEREYDTLLFQLQSRRSGTAPPAPCAGAKAGKDDTTRLEEQRTTIANLRRHVDHLLEENERLAADNKRLRAQNARLRRQAGEQDEEDEEEEEGADTHFVERSELWLLPQPGGAGVKGKEIAIPTLPPLEMPAQEDLCLDDLPPLTLPQDLHTLDRDRPL